MKITVTLGVAYWSDEHVPPIRLAVTTPAQEFEPDDVFRACNRIDTLIEDCRGLRYEWQVRLRIALHDAKAPSMSVRDWYMVESDAGVYLGGMKCESRGWSPLPACFSPKVEA